VVWTLDYGLHAGSDRALDPLYQLSANEIQRRIQQIYTTVIEQLVANQAVYVWTTIRSPDDLGRNRMAAMTEFLPDFEQGKATGRYLPHELPDLQPFTDSASGAGTQEELQRAPAASPTENHRGSPGSGEGKPGLGRPRPP